MNYQLLFTVNCTHDYYAHGRCADLTIIPTNTTNRVLTNYRCVLHRSSNGILVLVPVDGHSRPLIPIPKNTVFTFELRLHNAAFPLWTDLAPISSDAFRGYTNMSADGKALRKGLLLPTSLQGRANVGNFAQLTIFYDGWPPHPSDGTSELELHFTSKQAHWEYYVVTNQGNGAAEKLRIVDKSGSERPTLVFEKANPTEQMRGRVWEMLDQQYPGLEGMRKIRFVSHDPVPCRQAARKGLQLWLDDHRIFEHLPNPPPHHIATTAIQVDGQTQHKDSRFEIVKYLTQPLSIMV